MTSPPSSPVDAAPDSAPESDPALAKPVSSAPALVKPVPGPIPGDFAPPDSRFLNRELTWLEFNRRVLHQALDPRTPLLERLAFLAIHNSNLDEFFQKRVGGLKRQVDAGIVRRSTDGLTAKQQLTAIRQMVLPMLQAQADCYQRELLPALRDQGIHLLTWDGLTPEEQDWAEEYFMQNLFPVLTPLSVDPGHPFPFISNLSTSLGVMLRPESPIEGEDAVHFARVKVPDNLPGWVLLGGRKSEEGPNPGYRFIKLEQIIRQYLYTLFEGMVLEEVEPFRVTRNAAVENDPEDAEDLLDLVEQELKQRRFADVVRLEVDDEPFRPLNQFLIGEMKLHEHDVFEMSAGLDYNPLWIIQGINEPDLKHEPWSPVTPTRLLDHDADMFNVIRSGDVMVHHPYESFAASVERFIRAAATDPDVLAIKLTLYRTASDAPFIPALIQAAESGKQVVVLVELKARFDEQRNVQLAQRLEKAGIHVVYGVVGLKTHTKTSLVVRREGDGMNCYAHIGTGNYHSKTANLYTDLGLFTCDPRITGDLVALFHFLTGRMRNPGFKNLLVAPMNMRSRFEELIDRETAHAQAWRERGSDPQDPNRPHILAKMNSLEDVAMCEKLYAASQAGVKVTLIVRGFCGLRPGVPGLSENIEVISIIGRFLEHSRIYWFHNAGNPEVFVGSADWMYRNLNDRVECITPILDPAHRARLKQVLDIMLEDHRQAWDMQPDGSYIQRAPDPARPESAMGTHARLMHAYRSETTMTREYKR